MKYFEFGQEIQILFAHIEQTEIAQVLERLESTPPHPSAFGIHAQGVKFLRHLAAAQAELAVFNELISRQRACRAAAHQN